jgi:hypothetical protein
MSNMGSILVRCLEETPETARNRAIARVVLQRRAGWSRAEAHAVLLDYLGKDRDYITAQLRITQEMLKTYWKRAYRKLGVSDRKAMRAWVDQILTAEFE